jgi:hypothetical protein
LIVVHQLFADHQLPHQIHDNHRSAILHFTLQAETSARWVRIQIHCITQA